MKDSTAAYPISSVLSLTDGVILTICCVISSLLHIPLAALPLGRDQGVWSSMGMAFSQGRGFITDVLHFNLPGLGLTFWPTNLVTDDPRIQTALISSAGLTLGIVSVFYLMKRVFDRESAIWAAALIAVWIPCILDYANIAQKDFFAGILLITATSLICYADIDRPHRVTKHLLAGLTIGVAFLYKPLFAGAGIIMATLEIHRHVHITGRLFTRSLALSLAALLSGFLIIFIALIIYFWITDSFNDATFALVDFSLWYSQSKKPGFLLLFGLLIAYSGLVDIHQPVLSLIQIFLWIPIVSAGILLTLCHQRKIERLWLAVPVVTSLFCYFIQQKGYPYQAIPWIICALMFAAYALKTLFSHQGKHLVITLAKGVASVTLIYIFIKSSLLGHYTTQLVPAAFAAQARDEYLANYYAPNDQPHPIVSEHVANWIKRHTATDDPIYVWGMENQIYALANRPFASRHHFNYLLFADLESHNELHSWQKTLRQEYLTALKNNPPRVYIETFYVGDASNRHMSLQDIRNIPQLSEFVRNRYDKVAQIDRLDVHVLKGHFPAPAIAQLKAIASTP